MANFKAVIDYDDELPLDLVEILNNVADGLASDPAFIGSPFTKIQLNAIALDLETTHAAAAIGGKGAQIAYVASHNTAIATMVRMGVWANYVCAGSQALLTKLNIPNYDSGKPGKDKSNFSLKNGPASGQLEITVPTTKPDAAFVAMYSLTAEADLSACMLAGGSSHCSFSLWNMPVGVKVWVRWAAIGADGIGEFSAPYPIIVT